MPLLKGTKAILKMMGTSIRQGQLAAIFTHGKARWNMMHPQAQESHSAETHSPLQDLQMWLNESKKHTDRLHVYNRAIEELQSLYRLFEMDTRLEILDAFVWIWEVADDFLPLLELPTQEAVAIFAYFCVVLKRLDDQWWLQGWADHLMSQAYATLDEEHRLWIGWPIEQIGWIIPDR